MPTPSHPTPPRPQQPQTKPHHDDAADKHRDPNRPDPPPPNQPPQAGTPVAGVAPPEPGLPLGARPKDGRDPQSAKFERHAAPPFWQEPKGEVKQRDEWTPEPALDARAEKPPQGYYADGMTIADEQRARAAWVEAHGLKEYDEATDQRPEDERPKFDKDALIGGAFVSSGTQKQVQGVAPPTKRPQPNEEQRR